MRNTFKKAMGILLVVLLVATVMVVATADDDTYENEEERYEDSDSYENEDDQTQANAEDSENEEEVPIYLADYYAGTKLDLEQYLGKAVIINYFTEWCPYCMEEMPDFKKIMDTYDSESFVVLLVHPWDGEDETNSASVVERFGLDAATVIEDEDFAMTTAIGVPGYPTTLIVDASGYISFAVASRIDFETISNVLDALGVAKNGDISSIFTTVQSASPHTNPAPDATTSATP